MLTKKETYTVVTPIPGFIPRQLALDILHSHSEVITLNPLVVAHRAIEAPRNASPDEYYSTWYEITERIQWVPGTGKMGSGQIQFNGCFHNMPWGLQTHVYAPMNVDLRHRYKIAGNQPGIEPPQKPELGDQKLGVPSDGLYLRTESEIKCNFAMMSFVKGQLKTANQQMVDRIIKKAELLDSGILQAMMEDGKLKTVNPNDRSRTMAPSTPSAAATSLDNPNFSQQHVPPLSPNLSQDSRPSTTSPPPSQPQSYHQLNRTMSQAQQQQYPGQYQQYPQHQQYPAQASPLPGKGFAMELPGDGHYQHQGHSPAPSYSVDSRHASTASVPGWQPYPMHMQQQMQQGQQPAIAQLPNSFTAELGNTEVPHAAH